jgi:arylsulfatase A-like enzyme
LLFIYTDEQAFNTLETYGNRQIAMPNLNRLARQSTVFDQAYVTQPLCTPSRSTLLTGLTPHTSGLTENNVPLAPGTPCLPEMLTRGRYATGHFGKWHLGDELFAQHGFQEWISIEDGYTKNVSEGKSRDICSDYHHFLIKNGFTPGKGRHFGRGEAARLPEEFGKPAFLAHEASRFLREHRDQPFALYVNLLEPHMPFYGPRDNQYDPSEIPLPPNFDNVPAEEQPLKVRLLYQHYLRHGISGIRFDQAGGWRQLIAQYWGLCSLVDTHVGTILDTLEQSGLSDNTIVVFTSDHGDMMGAHQLVAKCVMYQEAVRVPFMIRLPGQTGGKRVMGPVSQIDMVPTLLDLMGQPIPAALQGRSLRPRMEHPEAALDEPVVIEWNGPNNGLGDVRGSVQIPEWMTEMATAERIQAATTDPVRTVITPDGWKLNCSPLGEHELYHLKEDPGETHNVFWENRPVVRRLRELIVRWQVRTGDVVALPEL